MPAIYYETARHGLIRCGFIGWAKSPAHEVTGCFNAVIKLREEVKGCGYHKGEILHVPAWHVVEKAGVRGYHQYVRKAKLPEIKTDELLPSRWP